MKNLVIFVLAIIPLPLGVVGVCCDRETKYGGICGVEGSSRCSDCSNGYCCGVGSCNIFCCNCDYGCINVAIYQNNLNGRSFAGRMAQQQKTFTRVNMILDRMDNNGDNHIDFGEFRTNFRAKGMHPMLSWTQFVRLDKNGDGMISPYEIDRDY